MGLQPVLEPHAKLDSPSANALQLYKMKLLFVIFQGKKFVLSKNLYSNRTRLHPIRTASESFFYLKKNLFSLN